MVDGFVGAQPEATVKAWVDNLGPSAEESEVQQLLGAGDEASLRQALELEPDNAQVITTLAALLAARSIEVATHRRVTLEIEKPDELPWLATRLRDAGSAKTAKLYESLSRRLAAVGRTLVER